jgi:hypothetical protein
MAGYMQQLASALQSGNLSSAQQAYSTLQSSLQATPGSASGGSSGGQANSFASILQQGLNQVGSDLQSSNLSAAQTDFSNLQQQIKAALEQGGGQNAGSVGHHHHHHHGGASSATSELGSTTSSAATPGATAVNTVA